MALRSCSVLLRCSTLVVASALAGLGSGCGSGGSGGGGSSTNLVLVNFMQASEDNVALNSVLEFNFSGPVDVDTVGPASIQIRSGPSFGEAIEGRYVVLGSKVFFEPRLPGLCSLEDAGLQAATDYRVTIIGSPEEFAIRSTDGDPLAETISFSFHTRADTDPRGLYEDQVPGVFPTVVSHTPRDGAHPPVDPEVNVGPGNRVVIDFSENIDPCSISATTVRFHQYATGDPDDFPNGFTPDADQTPGDPYTWGSGTPTSPPQRIRSTYTLTQTFLSTRLEIVPDFGEFPDDALLVVEVTNEVKDFGGNPMIPESFAFVTENRPTQCNSRTLAFDGDVPIDENVTTADVNTARAPSRAQGFLLFAGDGDNGAVLTSPSGPACAPYQQPNDNNPDDFDTPTTDVTLDTGASPNTTCNNQTDGSRAVVFEFRTFRIRAGRTVTISGANPAIILVSGDVIIENGGRLMARGSNGGPGVQDAGTSSGATGATGGAAVAGGGRGGNSNAAAHSSNYGENGSAGFSSPDFGQPPGRGGSVDPVRIGPGRGNVRVSGDGPSNYTTTQNRYSPGGGGGGHATAGATGINNGSGSSPAALMGPVDGAGGGTYGDTTDTMPTPEAGSGGGAAGFSQAYYYVDQYYYYSRSGGAGGGGGGFLDLTAGGDIRVFGRIDVAGGNGGAGAGGGTGWQASGGGGAGSGGGLRLLTPASIEVASSTVITAGGGNGGIGGVPATATFNGNPALANPGGAGGVGRLVFEDDDSVIGGGGAATLIPAENAPAGFYRGTFDASRFQGGGLSPRVVTQVIDIGPTFPQFQEPVQVYGGQEDFVAGVPSVSSRGLGSTAILIEAQGFPVNADGTPDLTSPTGWKRLGYFSDSGTENFPIWNAGTPTDVTLPSDSGPGGFTALDRHEFVQFRITFYLADGVGPFDPGPYIADWTLHFCYDQ